mmetsp:Transcript_1467/g.1964  ORF Transcript_1467/g.1964 Transcript_1467/m.1964 type:complete len:81 (+) Transcript_1467:135-377(+)
MLDGGIKYPYNSDSKKQSTGRLGNKKSPVLKLSNALQQYKTERIQTEDELISVIKKVNLDKSILFREKQATLWRDKKKDN